MVWVNGDLALQRSIACSRHHQRSGEVGSPEPGWRGRPGSFADQCLGGLWEPSFNRSKSLRKTRESHPLAEGSRRTVRTEPPAGFSRRQAETILQEPHSRTSKAWIWQPAPQLLSSGSKASSAELLLFYAGRSKLVKVHETLRAVRMFLDVPSTPSRAAAPLSCSYPVDVKRHAAKVGPARMAGSRHE